MPNDFSETKRIFIKMLKPPFSNLRSQGYLSVTFMDDSYLQGNIKCSESVTAAITSLTALGFTTCRKK